MWCSTRYDFLQSTLQILILNFIEVKDYVNEHELQFVSNFDLFYFDVDNSNKGHY